MKISDVPLGSWEKPLMSSLYWVVESGARGEVT